MPKRVSESYRLLDLTLADLRKRKTQVAVLPMGATEPHNLHLPYGTDVFEAEGIADRACREAAQKGAKVVLLPTVPIGSNRSTLGFPLTLNLDHSTLFAMLKDITDSLEVHSVRKLVIVNGHGGNYLRHILKDIYGRTKVFLSLINWWEVGASLRTKLFENPGEHGDEMETSVMLYLCPELVHMDQAGRGRARKSKLRSVNEGWVKIVRPWELVTFDSGYGDPRKASREKGKKYVEFTVKRIAEYLVELSRAPISKAFPY
jgi:creatinine amidohydrolase